MHIHPPPPGSPLWRELQFSSAAALSSGGSVYGSMLLRLADLIESRGERGIDLDAGEVSDWLREEARRAEKDFSRTDKQV